MNYFIKAALIAVFFSSIPAKLFSQNDSIAKPDSVLLKQIEKQLNSSQPTAPPFQVRTAPSTLPDISVIGDFQASYKNNVRRNFDAGINEAELSLISCGSLCQSRFLFYTGQRPHNWQVY